jgi:hypothetical protein
MKEEWVLFDSFKKAEKIYQRLVNENALSVFVVTRTSKVLFQNKNAKKLLEKANMIKQRSSELEKKGGNLRRKKRMEEMKGKRRNGFENGSLKMNSFLELVHEDSREKVGKLIEEAAHSNLKVEMQVALLCENKENNLEGEKKKERDLENDDLKLKEEVKGEEREEEKEEKHGGNSYGMEEQLFKNGYEFYDMIIERTPWRSSNAVMISCNNNMCNKYIYHHLTQHQHQLSLQLHQLTNAVEQLSVNSSHQLKQDSFNKTLNLLDTIENTHEHSVVTSITISLLLRLAVKI